MKVGILKMRGRGPLGCRSVAYFLVWWHYLHGDLLDQVPLVRVVKWNVILRSPAHQQLPQHGSLLSDLFGQTTGVNSWRKAEKVDR